MLAHWPALSAQALSFDDHEYLLENRLVQTLGWDSAKRFLTEVRSPSTVQGYYQPLTMISLMLDSALGGGPANLRVYHRTSLILHALNVVLIVAVLYQLFGQPWAAAGGGLLFGVHPMTVETIPWIGERKTLMAAFFALIALIAYVRYAGKVESRKSKVETGWYAVCIICFVLALMSKPTSTPLPIMLLLLDVWPLRRFGRRAVFEKVPFLILAAISSYITVISQRNTLGAALPTEFNPLRIPLLLGYDAVFYLRNIVWPLRLSSHYPVPQPLALSNPAVLAAMIGTLVLCTALVISLRWTRVLAVGWSIFFIGLLPTMGIIGFTSVVAADKFAYLPAIGLLATMASLIASRWPAGAGNNKEGGTGNRPGGMGKRSGTPRSLPVAGVHRSANTTMQRTAAVVIVLMLAAGESLLTRRYLAHWRDTESLCRHMVTVTPDAAVPQNSLANILFEKGHIDEALGHFDKALRIDPAYAYAHYNYANALAKAGQTEEAIQHYEQALQLRPRLAQAQVNLGSLLQRLGRLQPAVDHYRAGLELRPESPVAHYNLGLALAELGQNQDALTHLREAVRLKPDFVFARQSLAQLLLREHQEQQAIIELREAIRYDPQNVEIRNLLQQLETK